MDQEQIRKIVTNLIICREDVSFYAINHYYMINDDYYDFTTKKAEPSYIAHFFRKNADAATRKVIVIAQSNGGSYGKIVDDVFEAYGDNLEKIIAVQPRGNFNTSKEYSQYLDSVIGLAN